MTVTFDILRRKSGSDAPYRQSVAFDAERGMTVAEGLEFINTTLLAGDPVEWERSCKQKKCGACAMLINGRPELACDHKLPETENGVVTLEPLRKFPVVRDLMVDRSVMFRNLQTLGAWLESDAGEDRWGTAYAASGCLQCGCCLEVCPNFCPDGEFFGAAALAPSSRLISEAPEEDRQRIFAAYGKRFYDGCGKSLACRDICPAGIDTERLMVNSTAAAVWKRKPRGKK